MITGLNSTEILLTCKSPKVHTEPNIICNTENTFPVELVTLKIHEELNDPTLVFPPCTGCGVIFLLDPVKPEEAGPNFIPHPGYDLDGNHWPVVKQLIFGQAILAIFEGKDPNDILAHYKVDQ